MELLYFEHITKIVRKYAWSAHGIKVQLIFVLFSNFIQWIYLSISRLKI